MNRSLCRKPWRVFGSVRFRNAVPCGQPSKWTLNEWVKSVPLDSGNLTPKAPSAHVSRALSMVADLADWFPDTFSQALLPSLERRCHMYTYKPRPAHQLQSTTTQPRNAHVMSLTIDNTTSSNTRVNSVPLVLAGCRAPTHPIMKSAFKFLCVVAVSKTSLDHWKDTGNEEWKEHVKVMINRFQNSNVTAGLILATTALLLSSGSPVANLMAYNTPASYIFVIAAFSAALLSVISGAAVVVVYETSVTHKDMGSLIHMLRHQVICLLLWLAFPSICLALATCFLFMSIFIACFCSGNVSVQVITASGCLSFFFSGILTLHIFNSVGRPQTNNTLAEPVSIGFAGPQSPTGRHGIGRGVV
ncbi:hypothetical protein DEU56DRAFT_781769 [Suillus clintonianus]|uniref:uncharacterized protein n=1 Tax=Suillus clintonianus TaxID=1904413 RepID=UPI001B872434|nr:uncharacterized protein DEU56DRAFT_781769 [Suillus clintonianus]KAG2149352.1 hypothetical protein DEU56DRAFT_781769 [Suillus clintonianus]